MCQAPSPLLPQGEHNSNETRSRKAQGSRTRRRHSRRPACSLQHLRVASAPRVSSCPSGHGGSWGAAGRVSGGSLRRGRLQQPARHPALPLEPWELQRTSLSDASLLGKAGFYKLLAQCGNREINLSRTTTALQSRGALSIGPKIWVEATTIQLTLKSH